MIATFTACVCPCMQSALTEGGDQEALRSLKGLHWPIKYSSMEDALITREI